MRQLIAFLKKEMMGAARSGRLLILLVVFFLFGVMNPAIAKLTPWLLNTMEESMAESGIIIGEIKVDVLTSWTQFYKNIPIALIVFVVMYSSVLTAEYQNGTLVQVLTRGLSRRKVLAAKTISMTAMWTVCYWMCYGVTYGYNAYFWRNEDIPSLFFSAFCIYILGIWCIALIIFMSAVQKTGSAVLLSVGVVYVAGYVMSLFAKVKKFSPVQLMSASELLYNKGVPADFYPAICVAVGTAVAVLALGVWVFDKREI